MRTTLCLLALTSALSPVSPLVAADPVRYLLPNGRDEGFAAKVDRADARTGVIEGTVISPDGDAPEPKALTEGRYVAIGLESPSKIVGAILFSVEITEVLPDNRFRAKTATEAIERFESVNVLAVFRPPGSTTAEIRSVPAVAPVRDPSTEFAGMAEDQVNALKVARSDVREIAIAFHNFHEVHNKFPARVYLGPDGKPWHSWRVMLLPYLDHGKLHDRYRFDEPWDGPNNRKLIAEMPAFYHNPVHGPKTRDGYTNYAAVAGERGAMRTVKFNGTKDGLLTERTTSFRDITDGTANTILLGTVSSEAAIPWTKPEDVDIDAETFTGLGKKGGFAAPFEAKAGRAGLFAMCDGSERTITTAIDATLLANLLARNDGQVVMDPPSLDAPRPGPNTRPAIEIRETDEGPVAHLVAVPNPRRSRFGSGSSPGSDGATSSEPRDDAGAEARDPDVE